MRHDLPARDLKRPAVESGGPKWLVINEPLNLIVGVNVTDRILLCCPDAAGDPIGG